MRKSNAKKEFRITWPFFFFCRSQSICKRPQHLLLPLVEEEEDGGSTVYLDAYNTIYSKSSRNEIYAGHSPTIC